MALRRATAAAFAFLVLVPAGVAAAVARSEHRDAAPAAARFPLPERAHGSRERGQDPGHEPHTVLVRFARNASPAVRSRSLARNHVTETGTVAGGSFVKLHTDGDVTALMRALRADSTVEAVALDYRRRPAMTPNDPSYTGGDQPYLDTIRLPEAWDQVRDASGQVIAVVDTGVDTSHPDLAGRTVPGYNVVDPTAPPTDYDPTRYSGFGGHGTMVAGVAAANTDNGAGVAGAAWTGRVMPVKVFRTDGYALDSDIATGVVWAADHGASVINLSLGGPGDSPVLHEAIQYATSHGALVVAAAGNTADNTPQYPAAYPEALAVGATDSAGALTSFSSWGDWVDIAAPGFHITSTFPPDASRAYVRADGTSFSAPLVSGVAALVRSRFPALTPAQLQARLCATARDAGPRGIDPYYGHGVLDASAAVGGPAGPEFPQPAPVRPPNDVPARAESKATSPGGVIEVEGDVDWFRYDSAYARTIEFKVTPPGMDYNSAQNMDPVLTVYDSQLRWLGEADNTGLGGTETLDLGLGTGTYYISVRNYNGARIPRWYNLSAVPPSAPVPAFGLVRPFPVGSHPETVAVGDVTGDGQPDALLATTYNFDATNDFKLFVFAQNPDGTLAAPVRYPTHLGANGYEGGKAGMDVLDVDGDGRLDVALATGSGVEIFQQSASGTLQPGQLLPDTVGSAHLVAADMNADGHADLVVAGSHGIAVLIRRPDGTFAQSSVSPDSADEVEVGDVDGDGRPDIVSFSDTRVRVYHQSATGWRRTEQDIGWTIQGIAVGDVSGDNRTDVVATLGGFTGSRVAVFRQTNTGDLAAPDLYPTLDQPEAVEAVDVDGDGHADVVTVHGGYKGLSTLIQKPDGTLATPVLSTLPYATSYNVQGLTLGDVNGDGRKDAVIADYNNGMLVLDNQAGRAPGRDQWWIWDVAPADFATGVATTAAPRVTFQRTLDPASVDASTVRLVHGRTGDTVAATVTYDAASNSVTLQPATSLEPDTPYRIVVGAVRDRTGTVYTGQFSTTFRTVMS